MENRFKKVRHNAKRVDFQARNSEAAGQIRLNVMGEKNREKTRRVLSTIPHQLIQTCLTNNISFVSFALPGTDHIVTYVQHTGHPRSIDIGNELSKAEGFVFSSFSNSFPSYLLEPDEMIENNNASDILLEKLKQQTQFVNLPIGQPEQGRSTLEKEYLDSVNKAKEIIASGELEKIVLSRIACRPGNLNVSEVVSALFSTYPSAFRYVINIPNEGLWMGATPEPLLTIKDNQVTIVSLAATQKLNGAPIEKIQWSNKERDEQKIVSDYIEDVLLQNGIAPFIVRGPASFAAANVVHLQTQFSFAEKLVERNMGAFIRDLHPTPSISGMPREKALAQIPNLEAHQRRYYTGFLGPVNWNSQTHLYINLRCFRHDRTHTTFYAGAGITAGSNAHDEWDETLQKLYTMLRIFD